MGPGEVVHTRTLFLRCVSGVFLIAFLSLYLQIRGLYGVNGILPAHHRVAAALRLAGESGGVASCLMEERSLVCMAVPLGLSVEHTMELLALLGAASAGAGFLVGSALCRSWLFLWLTCCYLSLQYLGNTFMNFQWDALLLETGWLCVLVAPLGRSGGGGGGGRGGHSKGNGLSHGGITLWLVRWLLFRFMFSSGVVKLQSDCPTWWSLTALHVHYESQCIPTPLAWYAHHLPGWIHSLSVVATYVIEIPVPFLFFSPVRSLRIFSFYAQLMLQLPIILSGNYNFFNLLTVALCISLLDDRHLGYHTDSPKDPNRSLATRLLQGALRFGSVAMPVAALAKLTVDYFSLRLSVDRWALLSRINFTRQHFTTVLAAAVPLSVAMAVVSMLVTWIRGMIAAVTWPRGWLAKMAAVTATMLYTLAVVGMFALSLVPYTSSLDDRTARQLWPPIKDAYRLTTSLHLTSSYGLFRRMTGVGGRPEVQLEGALSPEGPWDEYLFAYKPGPLDRMPPVVAPHQPRLDWQMWFAALGTYHHNPWLVSLAFRLLQGEPSVIKLLHPSSPWRLKPPAYLRGTSYLYSYTNASDSSVNWWRRKEDGEYLPVFTVDHPPLLDYLRKVQVLGGEAPPACTTNWLCGGLDILYNSHCDLDPALLIHGVLLAAGLGILFLRRRSNRSRRKT